MPVVVACPKCQSKYQLPETALGKTIECKKCSTKFPATIARQPATAAVGQPAGAVAPTATAAPQTKATVGQPAARQSAIGSKYAEGASAAELAKFGLDGPIRRQADPSAETYVPPPKDILGNFAADPGFVAAQAPEVKKSKGKTEPDGMEAITANPYANQSRSTIPVSESSNLPGIGYASLKPASKIALTVWILSAACSLIITGIIGYFAYQFLDMSVGSPLPIEREFAMTLLQVVQITTFVSWGVTLLLAIALSMFTFQGYQNLQAMGTKELTFGSAMGAISWLIPLANWVLPVMCVAELSRASRKPVGDQWKSKSTPVKVWIWWGLVCLFWIGSIATMVIVKVTRGLGGETLESFQTTTTMAASLLAINLLLLIAAVSFFGSLAFEISDNQDKAWPGARKGRQGTGKTAPSAIPYIYSGILLSVLGLASVVGSIFLIIQATRLVEPGVTEMILVYGGSGLLPILGIAGLVYGVIHCIKAFK